MTQEASGVPGNIKKVSLVKGKNSYDNIKRSLDLIRPDLDGIKGKKNILLKPNLTATKNRFANTDARSVEAVLDFLLDNFPQLRQSEFTILEGSGSAFYEKTTTREVFRKFGYLDLCKKYKNVKCEFIEDFKDFSEIQIMSIAGHEKIKVISRFLDFDFRVSVAVPKTHNYAIATFGIKNMAGLIKQEDKSMLHGLRTPSAPNAKTVFTYLPTSWISWLRRKSPDLANFIFKKSIAYLKATKVIHHNIAELAKFTWPDLVVLDGFCCMDGNGPVDGFPVNLEAAVSSTDPLKADGIGARLLGIEPEDIGYLYYLQEAGLGSYSLDGLRGDKLEEVRQNFKLHPTYSIQKKWKDN
ncbi:MAG: DUF362 domain-containing protein [Candidatus Omnitrophota bacterium]